MTRYVKNVVAKAVSIKLDALRREPVVTGTPEEVAKCEKSYTGQFLRKILGEQNG